jgi:hypothetical protein
MKRPSSDRSAKACKSYIDTNPGRSELSGSRDVEWLEVHHIYGRGRPEEHDLFCNLILLSKSEHNHLHDCSPAVMEVECLWAKWQKHLRQSLPSIDSQYMDWNPEALSKICGCVNLLGRLEGIILPKVLKINGELTWNFDSTVTKCRQLIAELTPSA